MRVVVEHGKLLDAITCSQCGEGLDVRTVSFFTGEPIGRCCMKKEAAIKEQMISLGICAEDFRGCGYLPTPSVGMKRG